MMNKLDLTIQNAGENDSFVKIDGETMPLQKKKGETYTLIYDTNKQSVHLTVFTFMEYREKLWWLTSMIFFLISVFGIFDTHRNRKCRAVALEADLYLYPGVNQGQLKLLPWKDGREAVRIETTCPTYVTENRCYVDLVARKRRTIMRFIKGALFVGAVLVLVTLL